MLEYRRMRYQFGWLDRVFSGLRFRLLLLVIIACAPLIIVTLHTASAERRHQIASWRQRAQSITQLATKEEEKLVEDTRLLLFAIAVSEPVSSGNYEGTKKKVLDVLFRPYTKYSNLGVVNTNGDVLASAVPPANPLSQSERDFFQRALNARVFTTSQFPARSMTDTPTIAFAHPIFDRSGQLQGLVFATLDVNWVSQFGTELPAQLPHGAVWTEVDRNGTILMRYPAPEKWIAQPFPKPSLLKTAFGQHTGVIEDRDDANVPSFYAFNFLHSQLSPTDVMTILSVPRDRLFASADETLSRNLAWLGVAAALAFCIGWVGSSLLVVKPLKALVHSSTRLASGDLSARTGLPHGHDELGRLTLAFDLMAQALEQRDLDRKRASQKLQVLSHRLVEVQETERRSIARELHDEIGQSLTVAEMNLQAALQSPLAKGLERQLQDSIRAVEQVLEQVHDLSLNLRPSMLDDLGLEPALRWYTNRQAGLTGLKAEFKAEPMEHRLDPVIETECFRVTQEALTNIARHSQARNVAVELTKRNGHLHLSVRDDGIGFDVGTVRDKAVRGASLGLLSMEERASLAGGGLEFVSAPGKGTEIHAWFPLKYQEAAA